MPFVPKDRLERFRALRAKLDPAGDPAAAGAFYIDSPDAISARIAAELAIAPASSPTFADSGKGEAPQPDSAASLRRRQVGALRA
jgi:hypothetical protein